MLEGYVVSFHLRAIARSLRHQNREHHARIQPLCAAESCKYETIQSKPIEICILLHVRADRSGRELYGCGPV